VDTECPKDPYKIWNEASAKARGEFLVFSNSDVLMAPGWDMPMVDNCEYNNIVTGYLVEPGNIGVAAVNIQRDFGRRPDDFWRVNFEEWAVKFAATIEGAWIHRNGESWYMPCMIRRDWFMDTNGFDTTLGFPNPNDILFWNECEQQRGTTFKRVGSIAYHFQNLSGR
jgi:hypothetical protein